MLPVFFQLIQRPRQMRPEVLPGFPGFFHVDKLVDYFELFAQYSVAHSNNNVIMY